MGNHIKGGFVLQAGFSYSQKILDRLEATLSPERLATYLAYASGDKAQAIRLYTWNTALGEALYGPIQALEIATRNVLHGRLTAAFGAAWYDSPVIHWKPEQQKSLAGARQELANAKKPVAPPDMVAALPFGFWNGILGSDYENNLWRPHLRWVFPNAPTPLTRKTVHGGLYKIRRLRNRIAHHEPIFTKDLPGFHEQTLSLIRWMCEDTSQWARMHSRFPDVWNDASNPGLFPYYHIGMRRKDGASGSAYEITHVVRTQPVGAIKLGVRYDDGVVAERDFARCVADPLA